LVDECIARRRLDRRNGSFFWLHTLSSRNRNGTVGVHDAVIFADAASVTAGAASTTCGDDDRRRRSTRRRSLNEPTQFLEGVRGPPGGLHGHALARVGGARAAEGIQSTPGDLAA
jgi:hypothetical protein